MRRWIPLISEIGLKGYLSPLYLGVEHSKQPSIIQDALTILKYSKNKGQNRDIGIVPSLSAKRFTDFAKPCR